MHFCGVCMVFLYLKYIPTSRYYFWGSLFALNSKMKSKGSKTSMSLFFSFRLWLEFLLSLGQIAAISIRLLYRDIVNNTSFYLPPNLVRSAGDKHRGGLASRDVGSSLGIQGDVHKILIYHKQQIFSYGPQWVNIFVFSSVVHNIETGIIVGLS